MKRIGVFEINKKLIYVLSIISLFLCSCSSESTSEISMSSSITDVSIISDHSDIIESTTQPQIQDKKDNIDKIIEYIKQNRIYNGCFYDFNRDNYPELIEAQEGEYFCHYILYDLKGEITQYMGVLSADTMTNTTNMLTLYYNNDLNDYFYFGKTYFIFNGTNSDDEFYLWIYKINNGQIKSDCVGEYTGDWNGKKYWYKDIHFMDTKINDGYYDENEINTLLGVDEYLSKFEKIEEVNLEPLWEYDYDNDFENAVREELKKYPYYVK